MTVESDTRTLGSWRIPVSRSTWSSLRAAGT
jgi:hypothetical protein